MLRKLSLALFTVLSLGACSAMTGPDSFQYNADGESEPSMFDGSSVPANPGDTNFPVAGEDLVDEA